MSLLNLTAENFEETVGNGKVLVDFWAQWCGPCRMLGPVIEEIAEEVGERAVVCKVDIEEESALAARFRVMSIPTVIVFDNGVEVSRFVGVKPKHEYLQAL
ncbi:MAG: thioredoxin [Oscillospiraceae bacterium]|nr:thioredoxin [Oscillospiraceae bacterium]